MENSDSTSPERALFCREEEEVVRPEIYGAFQGQVALAAPLEKIFQGRMPPAASENGAYFQGRLMAPAAPGNRIFRGG